MQLEHGTVSLAAVVGKLDGHRARLFCDNRSSLSRFREHVWDLEPWASTTYLPCPVVSASKLQISSYARRDHQADDMAATIRLTAMRDVAASSDWPPKMQKAPGLKAIGSAWRSPVALPILLYSGAPPSLSPSLSLLEGLACYLIAKEIGFYDCASSA